MGVEEAYQTLREAFLEATTNISSEYFKLRVGYSPEPIYRERAYCYELYHQLRILLGDGFPYLLSGEIDKQGYEKIVQQCGEIKPDFLIHQPGTMSADANLAIIEVKAITVDLPAFETDLRKLNCMVNIDNGYYRAIMLIYGIGDLQRQIKERYKRLCETNPDRFELFHHSAVGNQAMKITV